MSAPSELRAPVSALSSESSDTRLRGRWLRLLQVGWVVVTLILIILNLTALPDISASIFTPTSQQLQELHRMGLSPTLYSLLVAVEQVPVPLVYLALGLLLFWRRSDDGIALFCAFMLVTNGGTNYLYDQHIGGIVPALASTAILHEVALLLYAFGSASLVIFFYIFPSGRFAPRWTRWCALLVVAYESAVVFFPQLPSRAGGPAAYLFPLFLLTAAVAQVYRYLRVSTATERQQTKWVIFGLALAALLFVVYIPVGFLGPAIQFDPVLGNLIPILGVVELLIPICIVMAVLRARLWDIDIIINRALVYGSVTGLLGALYAGLIIGLESLAQAITRQTFQPFVLVISTLVIATLFLPARRRLQAIIDRRFYRHKYDAESILASFSDTLRSQVDLPALSQRLVDVVQETMQPEQVSLWLRPSTRASEPHTISR
jgi:hypothetical protein